MMPSEGDLRKIGEAICETAFDLFATCGAPDDFGVQSVGSTSIVFGGTNRVILDLPSGSWIIDRTYCTRRFQARWDKMKGQPGF